MKWRCVADMDSCQVSSLQLQPLQQALNQHPLIFAMSFQQDCPRRSCLQRRADGGLTGRIIGLFQFGVFGGGGGILGVFFGEV